MFRVIIAGGRDFDDYDLVVSTMDKLLQNITEPITIVCGMAKGADTLGEMYAISKGYEAAYRREMDIKKKKRSIRNATLEARSCGAGYVDYDFVNGVWTPVGKYVKRPKNSHRQKFYKRYSNHLFRRGATTGSGKAGYKRCFDYRWEIE